MEKSDLLPVSRRLTLEAYVSVRNELSRKNELSRIRQFEAWLRDEGTDLLRVDLREYLQHLQQPPRSLSPSSINAHLNSIRGRYRRMMRSDEYRAALADVITAAAERGEVAVHSVSDQLMLMNELERRIEYRIFGDDIRARQITTQDISDEERGIRLSESQVRMLLQMPDVRTLHGLRDAAIIAMMLCTGVREHELVALQVDDLRQHYEGYLALRVREGKGAKQRLVVYGNLSWCLDYTERWLERAGIEEGPVFRGFWGASDKIRPNGMNVRQVNRILAQYPVYINGETMVVRPHDLRRTYARLQFDSGMSPEALQQNMGHASYNTTLGYIGNLDAEKRASKSTMPMPHTMRDFAPVRDR